MFIKGFIERPRLIEMQTMDDEHDNIVHLFDRDRSIQRRHQKIAPNLDPKVRESIAAGALKLVRSLNYQAEIRVDQQGRHYFIELNARLRSTPPPRSSPASISSRPRSGSPRAPP